MGGNDLKLNMRFKNISENMSGSIFILLFFLPSFCDRFRRLKDVNILQIGLNIFLSKYEKIVLNFYFCCENYFFFPKWKNLFKLTLK